MRFILFILAIGPIILFSQNVGINADGAAADPSAMLDVQSTTQGMLVPRMSSAQRAVIATPAIGLLIFDTTLGAFHFYDGSGWQNLSAGAVLSDADGDTKIEVEKNPDEDVIRFIAGGNGIVEFHADRIDMNSDDDNTILGEDAAENISQANLSTIIGARAGRNYTGDYGVFVGVDAYKETQGQYNTAIGYQAASNDSFGLENTFIGAEAGKNNKGYQSVIIGRGAGINNDAPEVVSIGHNAGAVNNTIGNIFIGTDAGKVSTVGGNLFIGWRAGQLNVTGGGNTYVGRNSGKNGNGFSNVHLGSGSGTKSTGDFNVIIGSESATNSTNGNNSVVIGSYAALWDTLSTNNVIIGSDAGAGGPSINYKHMKKENVLIGERAGFSIQGNGNTAVGYRAGQSATGSSNVFLGREAGGSEPGNNKLYISNTSTSDPLIYGEFDNDLVRINDRLEVENTTSSESAIHATASGLSGTAIRGNANNSIGTNFGGHFTSDGQSGRAVYGLANSNANQVNYGGYFQSNGLQGRGVHGVANAIGSITNYGGYFISYGTNGYGVYAQAAGSNGVGLFAKGATIAAQFLGNVETSGHMYINAPPTGSDARLYMKSISGTAGRVLNRQDGTEDVYMGDIDPRGGDVFIRANGDEKIRVQQDGGVTIGNFGISSSAISNSLRVKNLEAGNDGPLRADGSGNIYKDDGSKLISVNALSFTSENNFPILERTHQLVKGEIGLTIYAPLDLPDDAELESITLRYFDNSAAAIRIELIRFHNSSISEFVLEDVDSVGSSNANGTNSAFFSHTVDNDNNAYYLKSYVVNPALYIPGPPNNQTLAVRNVKIKYKK